MPHATTEIATLPLKAGVDIETPGSDGAQVVKDMIATILNQKGSQRVHYGRQLASPDTLQLAIDWDNLQCHKDFQKSDAYKPFSKAVGAIMSAPSTMHHVEFRTPFGTTATAPVVEMLTDYFSNDVDQKGFEKTADAFLKAMDNVQGFRGSASGWVIEELEHEKVQGKAKGYEVAIGWQSMEAFKAYTESQAFKDNISKLTDLTKGLTMRHVHFTKVENL